jgi:hypothetical protein
LAKTDKKTSTVFCSLNFGISFETTVVESKISKTDNKLVLQSLTSRLPKNERGYSVSTSVLNSNFEELCDFTLAILK